MSLLVVPTASTAADRADIPLKNWGGFAVFRDAAYDDLERLVTAGLADRALLSTKPMSRTEAARIVAHAIEKIRSDQLGEYNNRQDLEPVLDRLIAEFRSELAALGVKNVSGVGPAPGFFTLLPIDRGQVRAGFAQHDFTFINNQGLHFRRGANGGATFESRAQVGDVLTFSLEPELHANEVYQAARLATGYAKLTAFNVELLVGRQSLWWGPGLHGSLIMSNNAPPFDHVRLGTAEPFQLPWVGDWVGPTKILAFVGRLEAKRDFPHANLFGMRATISPFTFLELGASYANMFGGDTPPRLRGVGDYLNVLFNPSASDQKDPNNDRFRNNVLFAIDADLRIANVDRFFIPAHDARLYGEFGWDDTCCGTFYLPLKDATSYLFGVELLSLLGKEGLDYRFEYATSSRFSFTHNQFFRGYWTRGGVISHVMGTDGSDYYSRISNRISGDLMIGLSLNRLVIGNTALGQTNPKERRLGGGIDVSYRFLGVYSLFGQYQLISVQNRDFVPGRNGLENIVLVELSRSFR